MITNLEIENFKSIKSINITPNQFNIFIGEPNSGKSNILEALGLLSWWGNSGNLQDYLRFNHMTNLFYDDLIDSEIKIRINEFPLKLKYEFDNFRLEEVDGHFFRTIKHNGEDAGRSGSGSSGLFEILRQLKYFKFRDLSTFIGHNPQFLTPPHGNNLFSVVYSNKKYREIMKEFISDFGFQLVFRPQEKTFEIQKQEEDFIVSYPYVLASDTLKTIIFYLFAIFSNENSTLLFEEPEAHAFPYYTKFIGEKIAFDRSNQYFIVTHNPYFLSSILEKAPKESINVFITYLEHYQTKIKLLEENQIREIVGFDLDPFFSIKSFYEE